MIDSGLKQRLVGAAVLIALAVLFLPAILDGRKAQYFDEALIPPRPDDAKLEKLAQQLAENIRQSPSTTKTADKEMPDTKKQPPPQRKDHTALKNAYIIQVASFADKINAVNMVNTLKKQGFNAFVGREKVKRKGKLLSRVLIGPVIKRSEADKIMQKIKKNNKLNASIVVFDPRKH
ncbi:MAG TPA: hypothetical protein ENJ60_17225 [Aeromonadales bacterium]|nr:hypothetical protein [Aeromonadales bacterium]